MWDEEEDDAGEGELDEHVKRCDEEWKVEVEVFRGEHPFVVN